MADEKADPKKEATPEGAVEVDESDLDQAAGGISSYSVPTDSFSLNFTRTAATQQKVAPTTTPPPDDNKTLLP